jgi:hypothetical protein
VQFGRKNNRNLLTPTNQGMSRRADNRLDMVVNSQAAKFENSLAVDGVPCVIWNRLTNSSNRRCTCSTGGGSYSANSASSILPSEDLDEDSYVSNVQLDDEENEEYTITSIASNIESELVRSNNLYEYVGQSLIRGNYDNYFAGKQVTESIRDKLQPDNYSANNFYSKTGDSPIGGDLMDALSEDGNLPDFDADDDPLVDVKNIGGTDFDNASGSSSSDDLFNSVSLSCPICIGTGYVDEWQPFNGTRIVLDVTHPGFELIDGDINTSKPVSIELPATGSLVFNSVTIPMDWNHTVSLHIFNMGKYLRHEIDYVLEYSTPTNPTVWLPFSYSVLTTLKNQISQNKINIKVIAKRLITFTHGVLLLQIGKIAKIQVPELDVPNQSEFIDWNLTVQFEISSKTQIKENSYITEGKYGRIWKVESVNRRLSAGGKSFGYQVSARAIHSYEKAAMVLRVFGQYIDPFEVDVDSNMDMEL